MLKSALTWTAVAVSLATAAAVSAPSPHKLQFAESMVRIEMTDGVCSGVHVGGGLVLTAAHCTAAPDGMVLKTSLRETKPVSVLWANKAFDIGLLQSEKFSAVASPLDCRVAAIGEAVEAAGNPFGMEGIHTWGRVAGAPRSVPGMWKVAIPTDINMMPGMSGGPVFDKLRHIIGITVGTIGGYFGFMVPSATVCTLLART